VATINDFSVLSLLYCPCDEFIYCKYMLLLEASWKKSSSSKCLNCNIFLIMEHNFFFCRYSLSSIMLLYNANGLFSALAITAAFLSLFLKFSTSHSSTIVFWVLFLLLFSVVSNSLSYHNRKYWVHLSYILSID
jgi:hypothetical protein